MWIYCELVNGRLVDSNGDELNDTWPSFDSWNDADKFLSDNDIRATLR
jgi:hypothetical protein